MTTLFQDLRCGYRMLARNSGLAFVAVLTLALGAPANSALAGWNLEPAGSLDRNSEVAGRWEGSVQIPGNELGIVIDLAQNGEGNWIGSAIVPGFDVKGAALTDLAVKGSDVSFVINGVIGDPRLKGHVDSKGALTGEFQEAGNTAPFVLNRTGPPQVEPARQSTPVSKDLEGNWQGDFELPGRTIHVQVTLANQPGGRAAAKFHLKGRKDMDLPVEFVTEEDDLLTIESPSANFIYQGWFRKGANEVKGELQLGPYDEPLVLRPAAKDAAEPKP
jgi:hypothetical protein